MKNLLLIYLLLMAVSYMGMSKKEVERKPSYIVAQQRSR